MIELWDQHFYLWSPLSTDYQNNGGPEVPQICRRSPGRFYRASRQSRGHSFVGLKGSAMRTTFRCAFGFDRGDLYDTLLIPYVSRTGYLAISGMSS